MDKVAHEEQLRCALDTILQKINQRARKLVIVRSATDPGIHCDGLQRHFSSRSTAYSFADIIAPLIPRRPRNEPAATLYTQAHDAAITEANCTNPSDTPSPIHELVRTAHRRILLLAAIPSPYRATFQSLKHFCRANRLIPFLTITGTVYTLQLP